MAHTPSHYPALKICNTSFSFQGLVADLSFREKGEAENRKNKEESTKTTVAL